MTGHGPAAQARPVGDGMSGDRYAFSNGTEREAWANVWCDFCVHDHAITHTTSPTVDDGGCEILIAYDVAAGDIVPDQWTLEPPSLGFNQPSLMLCDSFEPCHRDRCAGDPLAEVRVEIVARVRAAWDEDRKAGVA